MTKDITAEHVLNDLRYLTLLARSFPTVADASTEIINLEAILNLPKGTEHFLSDIHGEHQAFNHVLKNASGAIKRKVNEIFSNTLRDFEKKELCTLIYYPEQKLELIRQREKDLDDWYLITLNQLVRVCRNVSSKYTRSKVRKALPKEFSYIIQELLHESSDEPNKSAYVDQIINTIISTGRANDFIIAMCNLIQRLTIDLLHIIGDIYDRGPGAHIIMDTLCNYHNFDIQWGNHDILWMGAAAGNAGSIANVIRMCMRYGNLATLEDGYGINLLPLATFAMEVYGDDPCELFIPRTNASDATFDEKTTQLIARMHKAITIIQFKLEGEIIRRRPEFGMDDRLLLHHIDLHRGTIRIEGKEYELKDKNWPTLNAKDPYALSIEEEELMRRIKHSFECSEKLKKHMRCLFTHGSMYQVCNSNLLFHASVPMNPDGTLKAIRIEGTEYKGKALLDKVDQLVRTAYFDADDSPEKDFAMDYILVSLGRQRLPSLRQEPDGDFRTLLHRRQIGAEGGKRRLLFPPGRRIGLRHAAGRVRRHRPAPPHHQRTCPRTLHQRREPDQGKRETACHRRRLLQSLPPGDRHCRLYPGLPFARLPACTARTVPVDRPGHQGGQRHPFDHHRRRTELPPPDGQGHRQGGGPATTDP